METCTPTDSEKIKMYEDFLHNINMMQLSGNEKGMQKLLVNADNWSYAHRVGNGELSEEEQQERINIKFWKLNDL